VSTSSIDPERGTFRGPMQLAGRMALELGEGVLTGFAGG